MRIKNSYSKRIFFGALVASIIIGIAILLRDQDRATGYEVSRDDNIHRVNVQKPVMNYGNLINFYGSKTSITMNEKKLNDVIKPDEALTNSKKITLADLDKNNDTLLFQSYQLKGKVVSKVRTSYYSINYIEVKTPNGNFRVYCYELPDYHYNEDVTIDAFVIGKDLNTKDKVSFLSDKKFMHAGQ